MFVGLYRAGICDYYKNKADKEGKMPMILTLSFSFYEPWTGALMTGKRELQVIDEKNALNTEKRYRAYFKNTYGDSAEVIGRLKSLT